MLTGLTMAHLTGMCKLAFHSLWSKYQWSAFALSHCHQLNLWLNQDNHCPERRLMKGLEFTQTRKLITFIKKNVPSIYSRKVQIMKVRRIKLSKIKSMIWHVTGKNVKCSVNHKMILSSMSTVITSKKIARTSLVTGMAALERRSPLRLNICWLYTCAVILERSPINVL